MLMFNVYVCNWFVWMHKQWISFQFLKRQTRNLSRYIWNFHYKRVLTLICISFNKNTFFFKYLNLNFCITPYIIQIQWLNEYNTMIRKEVGDELLKNNNSQLGYEWMMERTEQRTSNGHRNESSVMVTATLLLVTAIAAIISSPTVV